MDGGTDSYESSLDFCLSSKPGFVTSYDSSVVATDAVLVSLVVVVVRLRKLLKLLVRKKFTRVEYIARNFLTAPTYFPIRSPITDCMYYNKFLRCCLKFNLTQTPNVK